VIKSPSKRGTKQIGTLNGALSDLNHEFVVYALIHRRSATTSAPQAAVHTGYVFTVSSRLRGSSPLVAALGWRGGMSREIDLKLTSAASRGDVEEIESLIAAGADPDAFRGKDGRTPLQAAAFSGCVPALIALLRAGAHVNAANCRDYTALMATAWMGHAVAVEVLVAAGADVNSADAEGNTALHWASMGCRRDAASELLDAGARITLYDKAGRRPVDVVRVCVRHCRLQDSDRNCHVVRAQVGLHVLDKSHEAAIRALLEAADAWSRRMCVAVACYSGTWEE